MWQLVLKDGQYSSSFVIYLFGSKKKGIYWFFPKEIKTSTSKREEKASFDVFSGLTTTVCLGSCAQAVLFGFQGFVCSLLFSPCPFLNGKSEGGERGKHLGKSLHGEVGKLHSVLGKLSGLFPSGISMGIFYLFPSSLPVLYWPGGDKVVAT